MYGVRGSRLICEDALCCQGRRFKWLSHDRHKLERQCKFYEAHLKSQDLDRKKLASWRGESRSRTSNMIHISLGAIRCL